MTLSQDNLRGFKSKCKESYQSNNELDIQKIDIFNSSMNYLDLLSKSSHFQPISQNPFFGKKMIKLIEEGKVLQKKNGEVICEYGQQSNQLYFLLQGGVAVFIPKNMKDLSMQMDIEIKIQKARRIIERENINANEEILKLNKLEAQLQQLLKNFDSDLIESSNQYQISLRQALSSTKEGNSYENKKALILLSHSNIRQDICSMKKVGELTPGRCFGEIGALLDKPRTATIMSMEDSVYLVVSLNKYKEIFSSDQIYELNFIVLKLTEILSSREVGNEVVAHIATHFYQISSTQVMYRENDKVDGIYLIKQGYVQLLQKDKDCSNSQIPIVTKGKGSLIGIEDYFQNSDGMKIVSKNKNSKTLNSTRLFSATCKDLNSEIFKIDKQILDHFVDSFPSFKEFLIKIGKNKCMEYLKRLEVHKNLKNKVIQSQNQVQENEEQLSSLQSSLTSSKLFIPSQQPQNSENCSNLQENKGENEIKQDIFPQDQIKRDDSPNKNSKGKQFPDFIKYEENNKVKDFEQVFELYKKRKQRPGVHTILTYGQKQAEKDEEEKDYKVFLNDQKQFFHNQIIKQLQKSGQQVFEVADLELDQKKDDLAFLSQQNLNSSLRFIQSQSQPKFGSKSYQMNLISQSTENISSYPSQEAPQNNQSHLIQNADSSLSENLIQQNADSNYNKQKLSCCATESISLKSNEKQSTISGSFNTQNQSKKSKKNITLQLDKILKKRDQSPQKVISNKDSIEISFFGQITHSQSELKNKQNCHHNHIISLEDNSDVSQQQLSYFQIPQGQNLATSNHSSQKQKQNIFHSPQRKLIIPNDCDESLSQNIKLDTTSSEQVFQEIKSNKSILLRHESPQQSPGKKMYSLSQRLCNSFSPSLNKIQKNIIKSPSNYILASQHQSIQETKDKSIDDVSYKLSLLPLIKNSPPLSNERSLYCKITGLKKNSEEGLNTSTSVLNFSSSKPMNNSAINIIFKNLQKRQSPDPPNYQVRIEKPFISEFSEKTQIQSNNLKKMFMQTMNEQFSNKLKMSLPSTSRKPTIPFSSNIFNKQSKSSQNYIAELVANKILSQNNQSFK